jgi:hypothetical protein
LAVGTRIMNIQEFLLLYAVGDDPGIDEHTGPAPVVHGGGLANSDPDELPLTGPSLRTEIERHNDRTMTVVSRGAIETITRCGVCPKELTRPCTALRVLALPYARHPAYRTEWWVGVAAQKDLGVVGTEAVGSRPHQDLPPPGNARRRILRQFGICVRQSDFSDKELAQRGIAVETTAG